MRLRSSALHRLDDHLPRFPQPFDAEFDHVTDLEILRWLHPKAHSMRRSRADHVSRKQRHELADMETSSATPKIICAVELS
jgi:hypothetical protein